MVNSNKSFESEMLRAALCGIASGVLLWIIAWAMLLLPPPDYLTRERVAAEVECLKSGGVAIYQKDRYAGCEFKPGK